MARSTHGTMGTGYSMYIPFLVTTHWLPWTVIDMTFSHASLGNRPSHRATRVLFIRLLIHKCSPLSNTAQDRGRTLQDRGAQVAVKTARPHPCHGKTTEIPFCWYVRRFLHLGCRALFLFTFFLFLFFIHVSILSGYNRWKENIFFLFFLLSCSIYSLQPVGAEPVASSGDPSTEHCERLSEAHASRCQK
jgi:hypothetical protein